MPHENFSELLSAYLDGELAPGEREAVELLLRQQPDLAEALEQCRQLGDEIRQLPRHTLGSQFPEQVLAAARQQQGTTLAARNPWRAWLGAAACAVTAVAAVALAMVFMKPDLDDAPAPVPQLSKAERAVGDLLAQAGEDEAVVIRLQLTKEEIRGKVLDQALAAHGIAAAPATASNPAAAETAQAYKELAQQEPAAGAVADVVFIEADAARLRKALTAVVEARQGQLAVSGGGTVVSTQEGLGQDTKAEGEGGSQVQKPKVDRGNYAQHLPPRGFPLVKSQPRSQPQAVPPKEGKETTRVLVVVEVIP